MKLSQLITSLLITTVFISLSSHALSLQESFELAQQGDPGILAAKAEYDAAVEEIPQARAALLPNLKLDFFAGNGDQTTTNAIGSFYTDGTTDTDN
ncbi:MAG: TolC family protein, partial [Gammaproteobacteria bacterium]|nr:TolC family protein [Gammaproteobacteria bacterium]